MKAALVFLVAGECVFPYKIPLRENRICSFGTGKSVFTRADKEGSVEWQRTLDLGPVFVFPVDWESWDDFLIVGSQSCRLKNEKFGLDELKVPFQGYVSDFDS